MVIDVCFLNPTEYSRKKKTRQTILKDVHKYVKKRFGMKVKAVIR